MRSGVRVIGRPLIAETTWNCFPANPIATKSESRDWVAIQVPVKMETTVVASPMGCFGTQNQSHVVSRDSYIQTHAFAEDGEGKAGKPTLDEERYQTEADALEPVAFKL